MEHLTVLLSVEDRKDLWFFFILSTIWNTYQCYLKKTEGHVLADTSLAATLGFR